MIALVRKGAEGCGGCGRVRKGAESAEGCTRADGLDERPAQFADDVGGYLYRLHHAGSLPDAH
jgi:hypothetical protein